MTSEGISGIWNLKLDSTSQLQTNTMVLARYWRLMVLLLCLYVGCLCAMSDDLEGSKKTATLDAGGGQGGTGTASGQEAILRAVREGQFAVAAKLASDLCLELGLNYRMHFEQQVRAAAGFCVCVGLCVLCALGVC